eukprot:g61423.t1
MRFLVLMTAVVLARAVTAPVTGLHGNKRYSRSMPNRPKLARATPSVSRAERRRHPVPAHAQSYAFLSMTGSPRD